MAGNSGGWRVVLDGITLSGDRGVSGHGCLTTPPDGLGLPELRTEDVIFPQRDGARHYSDWYMPRIITLENVSVSNDGCPGCPTGRQKVRDILRAWRRRCDDTELVIFTDCHTDAVSGVDRSLVGPFGVTGRPRVAEVSYRTSDIGGADLLLRFDATDHRVFVLDADGTPGSGTQCVELTPDVDVSCREYPRCYSPSGGDGMCYNVNISPTGVGPETVDVGGTLCVRPTITLTGPLTNPVIENITTGDTVTYGGVIPAGTTIVIDLEAGTAIESPSGASRTYLLSGATRMELVVGSNELRLISFGSTDTGTAEVCWRDQVDVI